MLSNPRALPPVTHGSAFQAPECLWLIFLPRIRGRWSYGGKKRSKSLLLSLGFRPCSPMRMLSHVSELPWLTLPIRLVCPLADRKASKQNSCRWQYKISLYRRLLTITSDLPGARPAAYCLPGRGSRWVISEGVAPGYYLVVPSRHQSACGVLVM